jgi:hypothetical protein
MSSTVSLECMETQQVTQGSALLFFSHLPLGSARSDFFDPPRDGPASPAILLGEISFLLGTGIGIERLCHIMTDSLPWVEKSINTIPGTCSPKVTILRGARLRDQYDAASE